MKTNIYLLSQPIQTGKTSLLFKWAQLQKNVAGILTPDVNGKRKLYDMEGKTYSHLQLNEGDEGITIGRFVFDEAIFEKARQLLDECVNTTAEWIVVDEIGRLELDRKEGLEPAVGKLISEFKQHARPGKKLLLVVRDYLLNEVIAHYQLEDAVVLPRSFFEVKATLTGLVLCGGKSVRMGHDKALISYHNKPQYAHVAELMKNLCAPVFISCNEQQKEVIDQCYHVITDSATFKNAGPLTGVLTAFEALKETPLLVIGCDYPYFTYNDMLALAEAREEGVDVVCYQNQDSGFEEPLLAIYEKQCAPLLLSYYKEGNTSLRHFLKTVNTKYITTQSRNITSVDY
ncbi:MAG: NTP transferase domain-containing protein [Bacteroidota bacterium]